MRVFAYSFHVCTGLCVAGEMLVLLLLLGVVFFFVSYNAITWYNVQFLHLYNIRIYMQHTCLCLKVVYVHNNRRHHRQKPSLKVTGKKYTDRERK